MKLLSLLQGLLAVSFASLLIFLFNNSFVDQQLHQTRSNTAQQLIKVDAQIKYQVARIHNGYKPNYDGLVASTNLIKSTLTHLERLFPPTKLGPASETQTKLIEFNQLLDKKLDSIGRFKRDHSALRSAYHSLPKLINNLSADIERDDIINSIDKLLLQSTLDSILSDIFKYSITSVSNKDPIIKAINKYQDLMIFTTPKSHEDNIKKVLQHARQIVFLIDSTSQQLETILSERSNDKAILILQSINLLNQEKEQEAQHYRFWLFALSLLLLCHLSYVFFQLKRTSRKLKESLIDLEFQKSALDEHSIVSITDDKGIIIYANTLFCEVSKYQSHELIGQNHRIIKSDLNNESIYQDMWHSISTGCIWKGILANQAKDGSSYWVNSTIIPRLDSSGKPYQYIGLSTDITALKKAENEVELLARFPSENPDPVLRINYEGFIQYSNKAGVLLLNHWGIKQNEKLPKNWLKVAQQAINHDSREEHELVFNDTYYSLLFTPIVDHNYINVYARNITDIKVAEKNLTYQATHDPLTDLTNRYAFELQLENTLQNVTTNRVDSILLYIDLDQFKVVNDTCGHVAGDELLKQVSHLFSIEIRVSDMLARLGGDEFGVILNNCDLTHGKSIASKLLTTINDFRFAWSDKTFEIGASIGIVEINNQSDDISAILSHADIACYAAKDSGRNRFIIYRPDADSLSQRKNEMQWASYIPKALAENNFVLFSQLIKPLGARDNSAGSHHYEILIRLKTEDCSLVPPGAFLPAAERYDLISSVDLWVLFNSVKMLSQHLQKYPDSKIRISINLSGQSIGNQDLLDYIPDLLKLHHLDPACITFEITETAAIANLSNALKFINHLRSNGHKFALDDFGSGLSSFSYLKTFPVDYLKIDGSFVKDILDDPIDAAMVQSINQIGHIMNMKTIAEFVENKDIKKQLSIMGVDYVQGYGIEKPRPFIDILTEDAKRFSSTIS